MQECLKLKKLLIVDLIKIKSKSILLIIIQYTFLINAFILLLKRINVEILELQF